MPQSKEAKANQGARVAGANSSRAAAGKRYRLTFSVNIQNLFNRADPAPPVSNLSSPIFGQSLLTVGNFGDEGGGNAALQNCRVAPSVRLSF
jgi:hypothetical protein